MEKPSLPSWKESRILIQTLFDPFSLAPVDIAWLEKKYGPPKIRRSPKKPRKVIRTTLPTIPGGHPKKKSGSSAQQRRKEREDKADGRFTREEWEQVKAEYDNRCLRCGSEEIQIVPDHVHPLYRGGSGHIGNIQPLCYKCNLWKGLRNIDYRPGFAFEVI